MHVTIFLQMDVTDLMQARQRFDVIKNAVPAEWEGKLTATITQTITTDEDTTG